MSTLSATSAPLQLLEAGPIGFAAGVSDRITDANDALLRMLGYSREDLAAGRLDRRALAPAGHAELDLAQPIHAPFGSAREGAVTSYRRRDGSLIDVLVVGTRSAAPPHPFATFVLDVTHVLARVREQAAARVTPPAPEAPPAPPLAGALALAIAACPVPAAKLRVDGTFLHVNAALEQLLDLAPAEGHRWLERIAEDDRGAVAAACAQVLTGSRPSVSIEARGVLPSGIERRLALSISTLGAGVGTPAPAVLYARDLDGERAGRDRVLHAETVQRVLLTQTPRVALLHFDRRLGVVSSGGTGAALFGVERAEPFRGATLRRLPPALQAILTKALDGHAAEWTGAFAERAARAAVTPLRDAGGRVTGALLLLFDQGDAHPAER